MTQINVLRNDDQYRSSVCPCSEETSVKVKTRSSSQMSEPGRCKNGTHSRIVLCMWLCRDIHRYFFLPARKMGKKIHAHEVWCNIKNTLREYWNTNWGV